MTARLVVHQSVELAEHTADGGMGREIVQILGSDRIDGTRIQALIRAQMALAQLLGVPRIATDVAAIDRETAQVGLP